MPGLQRREERQIAEGLKMAVDERTQPPRVKLFICYSRSDQELWQELEEHLLIHGGDIESWPPDPVSLVRLPAASPG